MSAMLHSHVAQAKTARQTRASPAAAPAAPAFRWTSSLGNQTLLRVADQDKGGVLQRKCAGCEDEAKTLQTKLAVSEPGDALEQEADAVADRVMRMADPGAATRTAAPALQRLAPPAPSAAPPAAAPASVHDTLRAPGQPLDARTRGFMEPRFGRDFGAVRIHDDGNAARSARDVGAHAYTVGRSIVFDAGRYSPGSAPGRRLLAHELAHVVQQTGPMPWRLQREAGDGQPAAPAQAPGGAPAATSAAKACPFPSDFADDHAASMAMMCVDKTPGENPVCNLTDKHVALLNDAKTDARRRVQRAKNRMYMLGGPEFARKTASRIFIGTPPDIGTIKRTLETMETVLLGNTLKFTGATCADPLCESWGAHAAAYENGLSNPVVVCPRSFLPSYLPELRRTVIHEAVHLSGIDIDPNKIESYCPAYTCETPCQDATTADAWALFIDCLGGQLPEHAI